jgi:hypothetical protein
MAIGSAAAAAMPAHHRPFFRSLYFQVLTAIGSASCSAISTRSSASR